MNASSSSRATDGIGLKIIPHTVINYVIDGKNIRYILSNSNDEYTGTIPLQTTPET